MANKKISQLTSAAPLSGSEQLPIVQDGVTVKTTVDAILSYSVSSSVVDVTSVNDTITFTKGNGAITNVVVLTTSSFNAFTSSIVTTSSFNAFTSSNVTTSSFNAFTSSYNTGSFTGSLIGIATTASFVTSSNVYGPYGSNSVVSSSYSVSSSIASTVSLYKYYATTLAQSLVGVLSAAVTPYCNEIGDGSQDGINDISWTLTNGIITGSMSAGPFTVGKTMVTMQPVSGTVAPVIFQCNAVSNTTKIHIIPTNTTNGALYSERFPSSVVEIKVFK